MLVGPACGAGVKVAPVTSYSNTGGQGDRTSFISSTGTMTPGSGAGTIQNLFDGATGNNDANSVWVNHANWSSGHFTFDFTGAFYIDEVTIDMFAAYTGNPTFKFEGSTDNTNWVDLCASFTLNTSLQVVTLNLNLIPEGYRYMRFTNTGTLPTNDPYIEEMTFKIAPGA